MQSGTRRTATKQEYQGDIPHCQDLTLLTLDAAIDAGIFNFERCDTNSEAIQVYKEHFVAEEPEDLSWHGLFCSSSPGRWSLADIDKVQNQNSFKDWLIVAHVRNESGIETQWFYQWKGKGHLILFKLKFS